MKKMTLRNLKHATKAAEAAQKQPNPVIEADAKLARDRSESRAHFQRRGRATNLGDFKSRPGRASEETEAYLEDRDRTEMKAEEVAVQAAITEAAAADGIVVEDIEHHRMDDDGGPARG